MCRGKVRSTRSQCQRAALARRVDIERQLLPAPRALGVAATLIIRPASILRCLQVTEVATATASFDNRNSYAGWEIVPVCVLVWAFLLLSALRLTQFSLAVR